MIKKLNKTESFFEELFEQEILTNEKFKALLFGGSTLFLFVVLTFMRLFFTEQLDIIIPDHTPLYILMAAFVLISVRETIIYKRIVRVQKSGKKISPKMQYINTIIEASIPTVILILLNLANPSNALLSTPVILLYFIIITLSTLSLNFTISLLSGTVASIEFILLASIFLAINDELPQASLLNNIFIYIGKSAIIFAGGVIAGFVAHQLRKRAFNSFRLVKERTEVLNMFGQQISKEIADELVKNKNSADAKRLFVCVMFLDIRDFTGFAEKLEPEEIIKFQNEVFGFMIDKITEQHGVINQFLGDGYMATFGAPVPKGNVCENAVNAALNIIDELAKKNKSGKLPGTKIGIGLHAGYVVAGNVGNEKRMQYSISGNTVILSARIEQLTKKFNEPLLISKEVVENLNKNHFKFEVLDEIFVKGRNTPVEIWKPAE